VDFYQPIIIAQLKKISLKVVQFGFVTLFVAAFPLCPLFALLNNFIETRLDARKFLVLYRRPIGKISHNFFKIGNKLVFSLASHAEGIGIWYNLMNIISQMAILTNVRILSFDSVIG
jgi:hypothetical protein